VSSFYVENFGCRATQSDGAAIEQQFRNRGWEQADTTSAAEWVVLNTCAVTAAAEQDARAAIRRIRRSNPECKIVITGCYAQRAPGEIAALSGVFCVVGNSHKHNLAQIALSEQSGRNSIAGSFVPVKALAAGQASNPARGSFGLGATYSGTAPVFVSDIFAHTQLVAAPVFESANERTRPNLKIQDGCGNRCSFCIIPALRGRSRSLPLDDVIQQVNQLVAAGYREVVISGINLGRWGRDLPGRGSERARLEDLVRAILDRTRLEKLRISSVEPMDWSDSLIELMTSAPRIAKHAHVPMQSGSDPVLRRMQRKYRPWHYREKIEKIRRAMPTASIGADVMVGFPGETDSEFEETRRSIAELPFTYLHVFTFSARPGTPAASMPNPVPTPLARERNRVLRELAGEKKLAFMRSFIGRDLEAITLASANDASGHTEALTDNYLALRLPGKHDSNRWIRARVAAVEAGRLLAS